MPELFNVMLGTSRHDTHWKSKEVEWQWFVDNCSQPVISKITHKQFLALKDEAQANEKDRGGFVAGKFTGGNRKKWAMTYRSVLALDADHVGPDDPDLWDRFRQVFPGIRGLMHTTRKHEPSAPRYRLLIPFSGNVDYHEYEPISRMVASMLGINMFDKTCHQVERLMYYPSVSADRVDEFEFVDCDGDLLDPDWILDMYKDFNNVMEWPVADDEREVMRSERKKLPDPREKPDEIGWFNQCYSISEVIEEYLPDVYEIFETFSGESRYSYLRGTSVGGMVVYDDDWYAYTFHSTDPIAGHGANSFDLVRIHKFGIEDYDCKEGTPVNRRPSYKLMCELVRKDPLVKKLLNQMKLEKAGLINQFKDVSQLKRELAASRESAGAGERAGDGGSQRETAGASGAEGLGGGDASGDYSWMEDLETEGKGMGYKPSARNYELILENDPGLRGKIKFNVFKHQMEVVGDLPWPAFKFAGTDRAYWMDDDTALLRQYIGKPPYEMPVSTRIMDAFAYVKRVNSYHPIQDYLNSLVWDGVERVETAVIDTLGARDCAYTREVTRKWMIGAVKRVFRPGCKFENVLALTGEERKGKSTFFRNLGKEEWFTDQFDFMQLTGGNGKMAYEATQGAWIIEIPEIDNTSGKVSNKAIKRFISSQVDKYRPSHEKNVVEIPRTFIFGSTSNDSDFLANDAQGNGRFWPITILYQQPTIHVMTEMPGIVDQLWAEAMHYYKNGETPELSEQGKMDAKIEQQNHAPKSPIAHKIEQFLDMYLPQDWDNMTPEERFKYYKKPTERKGKQLSRICAAQLWEECLGGDPMRRTVAESKRINAVLDALPNWVYDPLPMKFMHYGNQRGYRYLWDYKT